VTRPEPPPVIYVDSLVYFDLLAKNREKHPDTGRPRWESAKAVFDAVNDDRVILGASALIEAEVNCLAIVRDGGKAVHDQVRGWFTAQSTKWTDVDRFLARQAGDLARQWHPHRANPDKKLGGADATHLAASIRLGCDYLMTHDEAFPLGHTVNGVQVIRPAEVWPRDLLDEIADSDAAT
jgi:predicted nucleic acid-binding protein